MARASHLQILSFLEQLGCSPGQARAYLALISEGPQTVLSLSRRLGTGRTKLYPLLEDLAQKQLIVAHRRHYGTNYEALPLSSLEFLVSESERRASQLRDALPAVTQLLSRLAPSNSGGTKTVEYRGIDGLKQVNWNLTKAKGRFMVFEQANLDVHAQMSVYFAEKLRGIWAEKKITSYDVTNDPKWDVKTKCKKYKEQYAKAAYIDPAVFKIEFETYIYNDCVTLVRYEKDDLLAVEIYNAGFERQQEQLFWLLWKLATPVHGGERQ